MIGAMPYGIFDDKLKGLEKVRSTPLTRRENGSKSGSGDGLSRGRINELVNLQR